MAFHRIHFLANETPSSKSLNHFNFFISQFVDDFDVRASNDRELYAHEKSKSTA
jgi:hypothetical protein